MDSLWQGRCLAYVPMGTGVMGQCRTPYSISASRVRGYGQGDGVLERKSPTGVKTTHYVNTGALKMHMKRHGMVEYT
jgi:hypothetical protein